MFTLRRLLTNVKGKDKPEDRPGAVCKIKYSDYQATYIGETCRKLAARLNEHNRATKKVDLNNNIAEHRLKKPRSEPFDMKGMVRLPNAGGNGSNDLKTFLLPLLLAISDEKRQRTLLLN